MLPVINYSGKCLSLALRLCLLSFAFIKVACPLFCKSTSDASWGQFLSYLTYKVEETGGKVVKVNSKGTSQICSNCGNIVPKSLSVRVHKCPFCSIVLDRDYNSALNILQKAIGEELAEFTPLEIASRQSLN